MKIIISASPENPNRKQIEDTIGRPDGVVTFATTRGALQMIPTACRAKEGGGLNIEGSNAIIRGTRIGNLVGRSVEVTYNETDRSGFCTLVEEK